MNIFPAIDLYDKKAVRLYKGNYDEMTVYSNNPIEIAYDFEKNGAKFIHMVDLEGAKNGTTPNLDVVARIARETKLFVEIGGGIRDMKTVDAYLSVGVDRVILGTAAVENDAFLKEALSAYGERIAVGIDLRDGVVAVRGWTENSAYTSDAFFEKMADYGVKTVICTDISRDGAMKGTTHALYETLKDNLSVNVIASGGVSDISDVERLAKLGLYGAIIGKAYYTGAIDLAAALEVAHGN
jgi:phosphoribosylformimino-5-aminoimidazole carboxamide ribotide isomerase